MSVYEQIKCLPSRARKEITDLVARLKTEGAKDFTWEMSTDIETEDHALHFVLKGKKCHAQIGSLSDRFEAIYVDDGIYGYQYESVTGLMDAFKQGVV